MKRNYSLWQRIFGPKVTDDDILELEHRGMVEGWLDWLQYEQATARSDKQLNWLYAGLRDGYITVTVFEVAREDVYEDDDPYQIED